MSIANGIKSLGVLGAGQIGMLDDRHTTLCVEIISKGLGISYVAALRAKVNLQLYDHSSDQLAKGLSLMDKLLAKDVTKGNIREADARQVQERVSVVDRALGVRALRDADMVIEVRTQRGSQ
jgi:3-hydroxybutyryl-CoA dehydrogenase